jgi:hypothetical protein
MAYIEENLKVRGRPRDEDEQDAGEAVDPHDPLSHITERYKKAKESEKNEGNVTTSMSMLTAIPEVDLGME